MQLLKRKAKPKATPKAKPKAAKKKASSKKTHSTHHPKHKAAPKKKLKKVLKKKPKKGQPPAHAASATPPPKPRPAPTPSPSASSPGSSSPNTNTGSQPPAGGSGTPGPGSGTQTGSSGGQGGGTGGSPSPVHIHTPSGHPLAGLVVTAEVLWSTDPRVGLDPSSTADQTSQLQKMANLLSQSAPHADRVGYLVPGTYLKSAPITFAPPSGHDSFKLYGQGSKGGPGAASVIMDAVDGGSGSYSLNVTGSAGFHIDGISLVGSQQSVAAGSSGWQMRAICLPTFCTLSDFAATGYFAGVTMMGDHMLIEDIDVRGNAYGIDFGPNAVTQGDVIVRRGRLSGCSIAAIGVARSGSLAGARFQDLDCSNAPYVIKRYDDGTGANVPNWIVGIDVVNVATDNIGNAVLCNLIDGSGITGMTFDHGFYGNPGLFTGPVDPSGPQQAAWVSAGPISDVTFPKSLPSSTATRPGIFAPAIIRVLCPTAAGIPEGCAAGERPFALWGNQNGNHLRSTACGEASGYGTLVVPYKTDSVVKQGCCLVPGSLYDVVPYAGAGVVIGIAAHDASATEVVHAIANGIEHPVLNTSGQTIPANTLLVPDSRGGVAAGSHATGQVIGRSLSTISVNAMGPAQVHIGPNR